MPSPLTIIFHGAITLVLSAIGVYVLIEKKMIVAGKLTGGLYKLESPAHIIMAVSFFMLGTFFSLGLVQNETTKKICQWLFVLSLITFSISLYI